MISSIRSLLYVNVTVNISTISKKTSCYPHVFSSLIQLLHVLFFLIMYRDLPFSRYLKKEKSNPLLIDPENWYG